jgi:hypothetical protein
MGQTPLGSFILFVVYCLPLALVASALTIFFTRRIPVYELTLLSAPTFAMLLGIAASAWGLAYGETHQFLNFQLFAVVFAALGFWRIRSGTSGY